jgi:hypothetical protein
MNRSEIFNDTFIQKIRQAADRLRQYEFEDAYPLIVEAIRVNPGAPQPHNLLGIWFELTATATVPANTTGLLTRSTRRSNRPAETSNESVLCLSMGGLRLISGMKPEMRTRLKRGIQNDAGEQ